MTVEEMVELITEAVREDRETTLYWMELLREDHFWEYIQITEEEGLPAAISLLKKDARLKEPVVVIESLES